MYVCTCSADSEVNFSCLSLASKVGGLEVTVCVCVCISSFESADHNRTPAKTKDGILPLLGHGVDYCVLEVCPVDGMVHPDCEEPEGGWG